MSDFVDVLRQSIEKLIEEKQRLTKERDEALSQRDEARREACKNAGVLRSVVDPDQDMQDWANYIAMVKKWDCYKETQ